MKYILLFMSVFLFYSCQNDSKQQTLENIDKKSAREVTLTTVTKGDTVYHLTKQTIWHNGEKLVQKTDTIATNLVEKSWDNDSTNALKLNQIPIYVTVQ